MNWDYFDKIYCISLRERADRRAKAKVQFENVRVLDLVEFMIFEKDTADPERGIYESHFWCIRRALEEDADTVLIFEDDILFHNFTPRILKNGINFLKSSPDWHIFFLGCIVKANRRTCNPSVLKVRYQSLTHAYIMHRRFAETIEPWRGIAYDDMLRDLKSDHAYALYPSFAFQNNTRSDNERYLRLDRLRRLLGGLRRLQQLNEFIRLRQTEIILAHFVAIFLLAWLVL